MKFNIKFMMVFLLKIRFSKVINNPNEHDTIKSREYTMHEMAMVTNSRVSRLQLSVPTILSRIKDRTAFFRETREAQKKTYQIITDLIINLYKTKRNIALNNIVINSIDRMNTGILKFICSELDDLSSIETEGVFFILFDQVLKLLYSGLVPHKCQHKINYRLCSAITKFVSLHSVEVSLISAKIFCSTRRGLHASIKCATLSQERYSTECLNWCILRLKTEILYQTLSDVDNFILDLLYVIEKIRNNRNYGGNYILVVFIGNIYELIPHYLDRIPEKISEVVVDYYNIGIPNICIEEEEVKTLQFYSTLAKNLYRIMFYYLFFETGDQKVCYQILLQIVRIYKIAGIETIEDIKYENFKSLANNTSNCIMLINELSKYCSDDNEVLV